MELLREDRSRENRNRPLSAGEQLRALKASVLENLNAVLNTRRFESPIPSVYEHCENSLLTYGLPDFTGFTVSANDDREILGTAIARAVRRFEPRLTGVTVSAEFPDPQKPRGVIHYRIDAWLKVEPAPEPVAFDTVLESSKWHFLVVDEP